VTGLRRVQLKLGALLHMMRRREFLATLIGGTVLGLLLGLAIGWWWWPVEWTSSTPSNLRSDFQNDYLLWVAEQYATTGDVEWARSKLGVEYWKEGKLAEAVEQLAQERGGLEAARLRRLAQAVAITPTAPVSSAGRMSRLAVNVGLAVSLAAALAGGAFLLIRRSRRPRATPEIAGREAIRINRVPLAHSMRGLRRFFFNWQNLLALAIVALYVFVALAAPWLAPPDDPDNPAPFKIAETAGRTPSSRRVPVPPNRDLPLGTVPGGNDVFYSMIWGTRPALRFGLIVALTTACLGTLVGAISGYAGGLLNRLIMRITDAFLAFPAIAGVFLFQQALSSTNPEAPPALLERVLLALQLDPLTLALILFSWMPYARIINANVARLKQAEYALAARTIGAPHLRIILRHLLPNGIAPAIVMAARDVGGMVVLEAAFTFIGVGGGSPWGMLLVSGRHWIIGPGGNPLAYWWVFLPATLALILFGIGWNFLGDGLNNALDPRGVR
jgi:peptide/nickel transport system permease protein